MINCAVYIYIYIYRPYIYIFLVYHTIPAWEIHDVQLWIRQRADVVNCCPNTPHWEVFSLKLSSKCSCLIIIKDIAIHIKCLTLWYFWGLCYYFWNKLYIVYCCTTIHNIYSVNLETQTASIYLHQLLRSYFHNKMLLIIECRCSNSLGRC